MPGLTSIDGITSGLDTTAIVDSIMAVERKPVALLENQQEETTNIISAFKAFQAKLLALNSSSIKMAQRAAFQKYAVSVSDEDYLTATASGRVSEGSYDIRVLSVARNHQIASQGFSDQSIAALGTGSITLSVGTGSAKTITIDTSNNSLTGIKKAINDAGVGVTATIVNDGSKSNPYRLVLTGNNTGSANRISITSNLSGLRNLNFSTATVDAVEQVSRNTASTSAVALGQSSAYTGNQNKTYTFTVAGSGAQTVGNDNITLNWSDGTNTGTVIVSEADAEVALVGTGADGLKLTLSGGTIYGGDKFQVQSFAPLLQDASDAQISVGSTGGSGSPITVTSDTNSFTDVIGGLTINVKKATPTDGSVNIDASVDIDTIKSSISDFIEAYNDANKFINDQATYDSDSKESGILFTEYSLQTVQASMRGVLAQKVSGLSGQYSQLLSIGIRLGTDGQLYIRDASKLEEALRDNIDNVINIFTSSGSTTTDKIEFLSAGSKNKVGEKLNVDITQAATRGRFQAGVIVDPGSTPLVLTSANNRLKLSVDGMESNELVLSERAYQSADELVAELQSRIDADTKIGSRGLTVSWVPAASGTGYLQFQSAGYGSTSKVNVIPAVPSPANNVLGLTNGFSQNGIDVAGTINGELATGSGQVLTGKDGNKTTAGLKLKVAFSEQEVIDGTEGTITLAKGVAARLNDMIDGFTSSGSGLVDRRIKGYESQLTNLKDRITEYEARLTTRREALMTKFMAMEEALSQLKSESTYLDNQLAAMNANWSFNN
jgi:flagellar hook-associated protein 2